MRLDEISLSQAWKLGKVAHKAQRVKNNVVGAVKDAKNAVTGAVGSAVKSLTTRSETPYGMRVYGTANDWKVYLQSTYKYVTFTKQKGSDTIEARLAAKPYTILGSYNTTTGKSYVTNRKVKNV